MESKQLLMLLIVSATLVSALLPVAAGALGSCPAVDRVNSFIGTGGLGYGFGSVNPGAQFPHAPMRLGPDTTNTLANLGYRHFSGYNYLDDQIRAFSHTHLVGAGLNDLGNFGVMPVRLHQHRGGDDTNDMLSWLGLENPRDYIDQHTRVWWSMFNKTNEFASPGRYSVYLDTPRVQTDLLATGKTTALHRYTYTADDGASETSVYEPALVVDVCHAAHLSMGILRDQDCNMGSLEIAADLQSFTATVYFSNKFYIYLYGEFGYSGLKVKKWITCSNGNEHLECSSDLRSATSEGGILFSRVEFERSLSLRSVTIELRVALSFISAEQAKTNFNAVDKEANVEALAEETYQVWCDSLSFLSVVELDGDEELVPILMSANYRARMTPTDYTEEGGVYLGLDKKIHAAASERAAMYPDSNAKSDKVMNFYSDFSFWDTFRTLHPWLLLTDESLAVGILRSISEMTAQQGGFPKWVLANVDISCMVGLHGATAALEGALCGFDKEFDVISIQQMLLKQATEPWPVNGRTDLDFYLANGYVSQEANEHSASLTLSYAFDDWVLGGLSEFVGDTESATAAFRRGQNYRNIWSKDKEFMCPRSVSGDLLCPKNATSLDAWQYYTEGDGLHWSTFVMHDPVGLQSLYASPEDFVDSMDSFFINHFDTFNKMGNSAPNPYFWIGNEVDQFAVWLFNFDSDCTKAQLWSRNTTRTHFTNTPHGVPGNEDYGAMSTWLLFSSLGIYPQAGTTNYLIGSPRVEKASLMLSHLDGTTSLLEISTENNSAENVFVKSLKVNNEFHYSTMIDRSILAAPGGCKLEFVMTSEPFSGLCTKK